MTRATIITPIESVSAAINEPTVSAASVTTSMRSLPTLSPIRPRIGVATEADNRYPVISHVAVLCVVCRAGMSRASTGTTIDCNSAYAEIPSSSTANTRL